MNAVTWGGREPAISGETDHWDPREVSSSVESYIWVARICTTAQSVSTSTLGLSDGLRPALAADDLRGTSNLALSGVHPKRAQDFAHRSDISLTLSRYTHTVIVDPAAVSQLARESDVERPRGQRH